MVSNWISRKCFNAVHSNHLIYNTCWEDPRLDREALEIGEDNRVVVITSAGCNALDYAICSPRSVDAVDMNPLQNSLLELKMAAIRGLGYEDFFQLFGQGWHPEWRDLYYDSVRSHLREVDQDIWDDRIGFFTPGNRRHSFYFRGTAGFFAWMVNCYLDNAGGLRDDVLELLECTTPEQQRSLYHSKAISQRLWKKPLRWLLKRDTTMAMLGVPRSQRKQIDAGYPGGISQFIQDRIEAVFTEMPLADNYFWRVYVTGEYRQDCCPEYLTPAGFKVLKNGAVENITTHTSTVEEFLQSSDGAFDRFVLLDHMDWLYEHARPALVGEWEQIMRHADAEAKIIWRSASLDCRFVDDIEVEISGASHRIGDHLCYRRDLAADLHQRDRVNTYGSLYVTDCEGMAA